MVAHGISGDDIYLFHEGNLLESYRMLGAHLREENGEAGVRFAVWAPNAKAVYVAGDFNGWQGWRHPMRRIEDSGIWTCFVPGAKQGDLYKYEIHTMHGARLMKADPYAFHAEVRPKTASVVYPLNQYRWNDDKWQKRKARRSVHQDPLLIYEVHLGSWKHKADGSPYTYKELADELIPYVKDMGYTHIEILPVAEHPYDRSWGYQATGYYAVTSRFGTPDDFKYFVDRCHEREIGVILDWVPGHFCKDDHGLRLFDGTPLYEYADPRKAEKPEWGTLAFDLGKPEVHSFLISNALFWLKEYHLDGLRVDAVASMLYLDFGKRPGEWAPNEYGGNENIEAIYFLRKLNEIVFAQCPGVLMIAEESSAWPLVSAPTYAGGLGFNFKWNMGWMNDMLRYMQLDPVHRKYHHELITFSYTYVYSENYVLPLSHDEVVYGKRSLLNKMPGDYWQKFANLRVFYAYMFAHPGKKLLFMGGEFGQFDEWKDLEDLDWELLDFEMHRKMHRFSRRLNHFYRNHKALWQLDHDPAGFEWIDPHDREQSVVTIMRKGKKAGDYLIAVCNFTPVTRHDYWIGVPERTAYRIVFNTDRKEFGGSGLALPRAVEAEEGAWHQRPYHVNLTLPPLSALYLQPEHHSERKEA